MDVKETNLKILIVNAGNEFGGGKTHMIFLAQALRQVGHDAQMLVFEEGPVSISAEEKGIPWILVKQKSQTDFSVRNQVRDFINKNNFDVVHTHGARANLFINLVHKKITARWVTTVHSDPYVDFPNTVIGKIQTFLNINSIKKADKILLISQYIGDILADKGVSKNRMQEIFNAIIFDKQVSKTQKHRPMSMLMAERLEPVKDPFLVLKALTKIDFDYHLTIVGSGTLQDSMQEFIDKYNLSSKVTLAGYQKELADYYRQADLFVLSSYSEGFPTVLLEAANYGIPSITTDSGSSEKMVPENAGWVIKAHDLQNMVKSMNVAHEKWEHDELRQMGKNAYKYNSERYSAEQLAQVMLGVYKNND